MPETFHHGIGPLPDSAAVCCEIANHLPRSPKLAPDWLDAVSCTHAWGVPAMPIWIAREISRDRKATKPERLRLVSLYAWYSGAPHTLAGGFIAKPWSASMRYATALDNARNWLECVDLQVRLGSQPIADVWLHPGHVDGFDFVPLRTAEHVRAEGIAMRNCVHTYADNVVHDRSRLWSIRRAGSRVATLEIAYGYEKPLLEVTQLTGAANQAASAAVWWAARRWLHAHDLPSIMITPRAWGSVTLDRSTWVALWRPYWLAKRRLPTWLPLCPSQWALWNI